MGRNPIDCLTAHAEHLIPSFNKTEGKGRQDAIDLALKEFEGLYNELESFKKEINPKYKTKAFVSPDKSTEVQKIKDEYQQRIDEINAEPEKITQPIELSVEGKPTDVVPSTPTVQEGKGDKVGGDVGISKPKVGKYDGVTDFEVRTPEQLNVDDVLKRDSPIKLYPEQIVPIDNQYSEKESNWVADRDIVINEGYGSIEIKKGDKLFIRVDNPANGDATSSNSYKVYIKGRSYPLSHFIPETAEHGSLDEPNHFDAITQMKNFDKVISGEIETPQQSKEQRIKIAETLIPNEEFYVAKPYNARSGFESPQKVILKDGKWLRLRNDEWDNTKDYEYNVWGEYADKNELAWDIVSNARVILKDKKSTNLQEQWNKQFDYLTSENKKRVAGKAVEQSLSTPKAEPQQSGKDVVVDEGVGKPKDFISDMEGKGFKLVNGEYQRNGVGLSIKRGATVLVNKSGDVIYADSPKETDIVLKEIKVIDEAARGKGEATKALNDFLESADQQGYTIYIEPTPIKRLENKNNLTKDQLIKWYEKNGFEKSNNDIWIRKPKEIKNEKEVTQDTKSTEKTGNAEGVVSKGVSEAAEVAEPFVEEKRTILSHRGLQEVATEFGFGDVTSREVKTDPQLFKDAENTSKKWVENGVYEQKINSLVEKAENAEILTDEQRVILQQHIANVRGEMSGMDINSPEYNTKLSELNRLIRAGERTRSAAGAALRVPFMASVPNDLPTMLVEEMNISKVSELTPEQKATVQKEYTDISTAEKVYQQKIEALKAENAKLRAGRKVAESKSTSQRIKKTSEDFAKEREDIKKSIADKWNKAKNVGIVADPKNDLLIQIAPDVAKLVKSYVEEGVYKLEDIVAKVHDELKGFIPDLKQKDIHNIIAGDYNKKLPTKNQIAEQIENIRIQAKLVNKLESLLAGEEPKNEKRKIQRNAEIESLRQQIKEFKKEKLTPDQQALKALKTKMQKESESLKEQLRTGDYGKPEKKEPIKLDAEALKMRDELIKLRQNREVRLLLAQRINETKGQRAMRLTAEVFNIPRTLMTIGDYSGLLRQNIFFSAGHPIMSAAASKEMFKAGWSQTMYDRWFADLKDSPRYPIIEKSRLAIADSLSHDLTKREENFMSSLSEKIPLIGKTIVKGSERSYTALLNKMRVDMFNYFADSMEARGLTYENSPKVYDAMAEYINNATGRSDFGETLNRVAPVLNAAFFSPRLIASRVNMLTYWAQPRFWKTLPREVRVDYFRNWISLLAVGGTLMAVAKMGGADVEDDPRSSDFGKIKSGNTRWDIWGGAQPYVRVVAQVATGKRKSTNTGKMYDLNGDDIFGETKSGVVADFFRNKLAPVPGAAIDVLSGRTGIGDKIVYQWGGAGEKEISLDQYVKQRLLPMTITGVQEAMKDQGTKALLTVGIPSTFGVGTQTYEKPAPKSKKPTKKTKPKKPEK